MAGAARLETSHFRHGGAVGYAKEDALCLVEACGPQTREGLAERLGYSRARDLERLHLKPLVERGLLERSGDLYVISGDYRKRSASVRREPYSTVQLRGVRVWMPDGGVDVLVMETGSVASEEERERADRTEYAAQRARFRKKWEAKLVRVGGRLRCEGVGIRAPHEERATDSHRTATAATASPTTADPGAHTPGRRRADEKAVAAPTRAPLRAKEVA